MEQIVRKLPIGIQNFEKIRKENCLYIDKTERLEQLVNDGSYYFLSRPFLLWVLPATEGISSSSHPGQKPGIPPAPH